MAKTCRTCNFSAVARECNRRHIWVSDTEFCGDYKPRETPLLVDALAKVTRALMVELSHAKERDPGRICDEDCLEWARIVLARYQEEVGDAAMSEA